MGVLGGSISYIRYFVDGAVPNNMTEVFERALEIRRFVPLHPEGDDTQTQGWVPVQRPFSDDEPITNAHFLFGERILLGYREDALSLPKPMIRDKLAKRVEDHKAKNGVEPGAQLRQQMQLTIITELRRRVLPKSKVVDVLWDTSRNELRFFARGKGVTERFIELFEQTFEVRLRQKTHAELALSADLPMRAKSMLEQLKPAEIFRPVVRTEVN